MSNPVDRRTLDQPGDIVRFLSRSPPSGDESLRRAIAEHFLADEATVLTGLLPLAELDPRKAGQAGQEALLLVDSIRRHQAGRIGIEALLNEFSLSSEEGIVLMCLAEALLRVPDHQTADQLIRDKLSSGNWAAHVGHGNSLFVNASAWGLLFTGRLLTYSPEQQQRLGGILQRLAGRLGQTVTHHAARFAVGLMADQFVFDEKIAGALSRARALEEKGYRFSYDMLGEGARTREDAERYFRRYLDAIVVIGEQAAGSNSETRPGISVKLSAIHPRFEESQRDRTLNELVPRLSQLALAAREADIGLTVDAEEASRLDLSLNVIEALCSNDDLAGWNGFGLAVQAYQKRALPVIEWCRDLAARTGRRLMVRLVKGAYWDAEIKWAQLRGLADYPVFTRKQGTDVCYLACARRLLDYRDWLDPQFATHNACTAAAILAMDDEHDGFEFQRLYGMGEALYETVRSRHGVPCRIYAPVGEHRDLLAYLVRRLLENGANSSFVNRLVDDRVPTDQLVRDPVRELKRLAPDARRNPAIVLPADLYGVDRPNSRGIDPGDSLELTRLVQGMDAAWQRLGRAIGSGRGEVAVLNPADRDELLGWRNDQAPEEIERQVRRVQSAFDCWSGTSTRDRVQLLNRFAERLEQHRDELMALCVKEGGKTVLDSLAEVREAADLCRYYALQAKTLPARRQYRPRGVILCISPWNFPLAIFTGQITAALAAGNTVVAKPSEQTVLIARRVIALLNESGLPEGAVELVISPGPQVGEQLLPDPRIKGVMFTGSTETARQINRRLACRGDAPVPLIAETGGQNAMIVDSTALPEQVVDDVIRSAFHSAGQRCSSLRALYLQREIAPRVLDLLMGAMGELHIGDPALLSTDIGPLIDRNAVQRLERHAEEMRGKAELLYACNLPIDCQNGWFFGPRLYRIPTLSVLTSEVFGPVLHAILYEAGDIDDVIEQINASGYGLTLGIHSRIHGAADHICRRAQVGNIYINRDQIGAVVGVQPFGGRGLSGTGPKAGGPHYLFPLLGRKPASAGSREGVRQEGDNGQISRTVDGTIVDRLKLRQPDWQKIPAPSRLPVLQRFLRQLSSRKLLAASVCEDIATLAHKAASRLAKPLEFHGATGETNYLILEPRGVVLGVLTDRRQAKEWLTDVTLALIAGNAVLATAPDRLTEWVADIFDLLAGAGLPAESIGLVRTDRTEELRVVAAHPDLAAVALPPGCAWRRQLAQMLAERPGRIVPLICEPAGEYLFYRFVVEKTVTENTTAAGGNASLMALGD